MAGKAPGIHLPYEPAKVLHKDAEECGDARHSTTDHEHTTTAAAVSAVMNNTQPPVNNKETVEHAGNAIQQAKSYATSWNRRTEVKTRAVTPSPSATELVRRRTAPQTMRTR
jgi:hypothetical protein